MNEALKKLAEIRILVARMETVGYIVGNDQLSQANELRQKCFKRDAERLNAIAAKMHDIFKEWKFMTESTPEREENKC